MTEASPEARGASHAVRRPSRVAVDPRARGDAGRLHRASSLRLDGPVDALAGRVDRYGWRSAAASAEEPDGRASADASAEARREKKWLAMAARWGEFWGRRGEKVRARVRKGIQERLRGVAWRLILDADPPPARPPLEALLARGEPACLRVIDADVPRTMPGHAMFEAAPLRAALRRVLHAYANHDPALGYVQGMGFIAAMLLSYLDEGQALWCFAAVMGGALQHRRLFLGRFAGLRRLSAAWDALLALKYPRVAEHFAGVGLEPILYTAAWFLTAFMALDLHPEVRIRLFDMFITFGYRALFSFALVIVSTAKAVLATAGVVDCMELLQRPEARMPHWRAVMAKFDKKWLSAKEYDACLKKAGAEEGE